MSWGQPRGAVRDALEVQRERLDRDACDAEVLALRSQYLGIIEPPGWILRQRGDDGMLLDNNRTGRRVIVSLSREADGNVWLHASISRRDRALPTYADLAEVHRTFIGDRKAYQLFVPESEHVNLYEVLHLWACLTSDVTPDFTAGTGSI